MKVILFSLLLVASSAFATTASADTSLVQVGVLECDVDGGFGLIFGSSKAVVCEFKRKGYTTEVYEGSLDKLGIDLGVTAGGKIAWLVFAATDEVDGDFLAGNYVGASAEASLGLGVGANWLVGGFEDSIALQPWSISGSIGINWSWTWTKLSLN